MGDTLSEDPSIKFDEIPRFTPECFATIHSHSTATGKRFREGLDQLLREGVAQSFELKDSLHSCAAARRGGSAAVRGAAIPARVRIRCTVPY